MLQLDPVAVLYVLISMDNLLDVEIFVPDVYAIHEPLSNLYSNTSATVPAPPVPADKVTDTFATVLHIVPAAVDGVNVPDTGCAFTVHITEFTVEVLQFVPVAVL